MMTEQEAKTLAAEIEGNRYWFVFFVGPHGDTDSGEWCVHLIHRDLQRGILLYNGDARDLQRIRDGAIGHRVLAARGEPWS